MDSRQFLDCLLANIRSSSSAEAAVVVGVVVAAAASATATAATVAANYYYYDYYEYDDGRMLLLPPPRLLLLLLLRLPTVESTKAFHCRAQLLLAIRAFRTCSRAVQPQDTTGHRPSQRHPRTKSGYTCTATPKDFDRWRHKNWKLPGHLTSSPHTGVALPKLLAAWMISAHVPQSIDSPLNITPYDYTKT